MSQVDAGPKVAIAAVLSDIEFQRAIVDSALSRPARWRGPIRRELYGRDSAQERQRYAEAFDVLVGSPSDVVFDAELALRLHDLVIGGSTFRQGDVRIGHDGNVAAAADVPGLVAEACARADSGSEGSPLAAARLHLSICRIHPFADGNGRVARLMASLVLLRGGYRSTLFTAVEQHFHADPGAYGRAFRSLDNSSDESWLLVALTAMQSHSAIVAWLLLREKRLRLACRGLYANPLELDAALADFDLGADAASQSSVGLRVRETPLHKLLERLDPRAQSELVYQARRVRDEAAEQRDVVTRA